MVTNSPIVPPPSSQAPAEDVAQTGAVGIVADGDVDRSVGAQRLAHQLGEDPALQVVGRDRLPEQRRPRAVQLGQRRVRAAGEHQDVIGDGDGLRRRAGDRAEEVADDDLHLIDGDQLGRRLDAALGVALAVLRVGQDRLQVSQPGRGQLFVEVVDAERRPPGSRPALQAPRRRSSRRGRRTRG